jgi:hypothetical protein
VKLFIDKYSLLLSLSCFIFLIATFFYANTRQENGKVASLQPHYAILFPANTPFREVYQSIVQSGGIPIKSTTFNNIIIASSSSDVFYRSIINTKALIALPISRIMGCY